MMDVHDQAPNSESPLPTEVSAESAAPELPPAIQHYKVIREIGSGGMGRVLKCLDTKLNRYIALKMLHPALSLDDSFLARFRREALAVAKIRHPNIVQIYSIDDDDGTLFFTMEYVEGEGLERVLERRGRLPEQEAVQIIKQAVEGLAHVHDTGILHRDIKPSNILIDASNRVMLSDFGLAKMDYQRVYKSAGRKEGVSSRPPAETDPDMVMGTPYYIAPENLQDREPDERGDLYSLGVVFYEMLTGQLPFDGPSVQEIFHAHLTEIPAPIGELAPETSLQVANVVYRCIEKNPSARYQDCTELLTDLNKIISKWHMSREIEERKRLSVEMARAMIPDKSAPTGNRNVTRLITLTVVMLVLGALLMVTLDMFSHIAPSLPPGSYQSDLQWTAGTSARLAGEVIQVDSGDGTAIITVRRTFEPGMSDVAVELKTQTGDGPALPAIGEVVIFEGRVIKETRGFRLTCPSPAYLRRPAAISAQVRKDGRFEPIDPVALYERTDETDETDVHVSGTVVNRRPGPGGLDVVILSEGDAQNGAIFRFVSDAYGNFDAAKLRTGDRVKIEGVFKGVSQDLTTLLCERANLIEHHPFLPSDVDEAK